MKQFRVYLQSELSKLSSREDASAFRKCVSPDVLKICNLPLDVDFLVESFSSEEKINTYLNSIDHSKWQLLTKSCDQEWRKNGVFDKLKNHSDWKEEARSS